MRYPFSLVLSILVIFFSFIILHEVVAQDLNNVSEIYEQRCGVCHDQPNTQLERPAPPLSLLKNLSANSIYSTLTQGVMRIQSAGLSNIQARNLAEFISDDKLTNIDLIMTKNLCRTNTKFQFETTDNSWSGWGKDTANTRSSLNEGITSDNLEKLKLKWVFGLPGEDQPRSQPAVVGGRLFIGSKAGAIYSLDSKTGCSYWTYLPKSGVRSAISLGSVTLPSDEQAYAVYFQDLGGRAYAINAQDGSEIWVTQVEKHPGVRGTGSVTFYKGNLYVPSAGVVEETNATSAQYPCCTFRGSMSKLDGQTGEILWRTYTVPEPQPRGVSKEGITLFGPAGAGIWNAATIDVERGVLYTSTGNAYGEPSPVTSDAVIAMSLETGEILWVNQATPSDVFISGCGGLSSETNPNCPNVLGPDLDFSASPVLTKTEDGQDILVIPQKSGVTYGLDPVTGSTLWEYRVGKASAAGGWWGAAVAEGLAYVGVGGYSNPDSGGIHAIKVDTGEVAWTSPPADLLCQKGNGCRATQSAAVTAIPGAVFSGAADGGMRAYSARDGKVIWTFDSNPHFESINGITTKGGSFDGPGPVVVDGMMYIISGNCCIVGRPGNALFAFSLESE
jgi:polyvinyl alcohol dehydrogenase (cytochrome)